jgi:hypothetical protein
MKAADHIERNPRLFNFDVFEMPPDCGTPGCALGWIGAFSEIKFEHTGSFIGVKYDVAPQALGITSTEFYDRMDALGQQRFWHRDAKLCAQKMRLYAAKYHAPTVVVVPDWNALAAQQTVSTEAVSQELVHG